MSSALNFIFSQAFVLPAEDRMRLALVLMESVETGNPTAANEAWPEEISRRISSFDAGLTKSVPAADVFRKLRGIAPDR